MRTATLVSLAFALTLPATLGAESEGIRYFGTRTIDLDLSAERAGAAPVRAIRLWYTTDDGLTWQPAPESKRSGSPESFTAPADGAYGFRAVAIDGAGHEQAPPQPGDPPEVRCVIDTRAPQIEVRSPLGGTPIYAGTPLVLDWEAVDENLAENPVAIRYRRDAGSPWEEVKLLPEYPAAGRMQWFTPFVDGALELELAVRDRAQNRSAWRTPLPVSIVPYTGFRGARNLAADPCSSFRRFPIFYRVTSYTPIELNTVEIWYRRDLGEWQRTTDPDRLSPFLFEAEEDGRYYFYLRALSHNQTADRAAPGPDTPYDLPVLVDTHPPSGELIAGGGAEREYHRAGDVVRLEWRLDEENPAPQGCRLEVSIDGGATWRVLEDRLDVNQGVGEYRWRPPIVELESMMFRLVARDLADNEERFQARTRLYLVDPMVDGRQMAKEHHRRAMVLLESGERRSILAAIERLDLALSYDPTSAAAWHDRGSAYTLLGEHERALDDYRKAHELVPGDIGFKFSVVQGYLNMHRSGADPDKEYLGAARNFFSTLSKVEVYQSDEYRSLLATYRVLESALAEDEE